MTDHWLQSAFTNDVLVAELLLRAKHSSDLDSDSGLLRRRSQSTTTTSTPITTILLPRWGHRKNRSKSTSPTTTAVVKTGGKEHRGSPTTHLSWSGGGSGGSSSDGYDDSRPSDLSSGCGSIKLNEGASTSSYHKSEKRKAFLNEQDTTSIGMPLNQQIATCGNMKRIKIDLDQNQMKLPSRVPISCRVEAETVDPQRGFVVDPQRGFVLPDLNMTPNEEDLAMMMS